MRGLSTIFRDPISGLTHLASALAAAAGLAALLLAAPADPRRQAALAIYGISLVLLFSASASYHLIKASPGTTLLLRRLDHAAIFILIAGSYTPISLIVLTGVLGTIVLSAIWTLAAAGILLKVVFIEKVSRWVSAGLYILMGWLALAVVVPLVRGIPLGGLLWLLAGGLLYTGGAVIYARKWLDFIPGVFGSHEVWHIFVSAAAAAHYVLIFGYIAGR
jgi:hemolysin III